MNSDAMNREYGVWVAHIAGVSFAGVKGAVRDRRSSPGFGCNRNRINELGNGIASAQKSKCLHRQKQGEKRKAFAAVTWKFPDGIEGMEPEEEKWHLNCYKVSWSLTWP